MGLVDGVGCWAEVADPDAARRAQPALFVDRDGVVVAETDYLGRPEQVEPIPGAAEAIARFNEAGIPVVSVTNQSGIARGFFGWDDFEAVEREVERRLAEAGARLDAVFACGYHEAGEGALAVRDHPWRKPNPGMLLAAADRLGVRLGASWIAGDRATDIEAGRAAGLAGGMHVATGYGDDDQRAASLALAGPGFEVVGIADLGGAAWLRDTMGQVAC